MEPLDEDNIITQAAASIGINDIKRMAVLQIDEKLLPKDYFRRAIDYAKIRHDLGQGVCIPGVEATADYEYVLRRRNTESQKGGGETARTFP